MINRFPFPIRFHFLFWLIFAGAILTGQFQQILTLFLIILIHEFGHIFMAAYYNWKITELTILPFGGVVKMEPSRHEAAWEEFWIALAGPICNSIMTVIGYVLFLVGAWSWDWTFFFMMGNLTIACFNLLPIYPLDGGRVVQVLLSLTLPFKRAMVVSLYIGIVVILFVMVASFNHLLIGLQLWFILPYLLLITILEFKRIPYRFLQFLLSRYNRVGDLLPNRFSVITVQPNQTIRLATGKMYRNHYHFFLLRTKKDEVKSFSEKRILQLMFEQKQPLKKFSEIDFKDVPN